jgi:hypothetical protein
MDRSHSPALLVIHGIGTQLPGEVLSQCVKGLLGVCSEATLQDSRSSPIGPESIIRNELDAVRIVTPDVTIRLYEVHWADLLPDEAVNGSFSKFDFEETTWFPWLNWRAGLLPRSEYPRWLICARTLELLLLQIAASLGLEIVMGVAGSPPLRWTKPPRTSGTTFIPSLVNSLATRRSSAAANAFSTAWKPCTSAPGQRAPRAAPYTSSHTALALSSRGTASSGVCRPTPSNA